MRAPALLTSSVAGTLAAGLTAGLLLAGCTSEDDTPPSPSPVPSPVTGTTSSPTASPTETPSPTATSTPDVRGQAARGFSHPVEDRNYPQVGDPGVDALHYELELTWDPDSHRLEGVETIDLRATRDADHVQLDLAHPLQVDRLLFDGRPATYDHRGKDLVVDADVEEDGRYSLVLTYAGKPRPVPAPVQRSDFDTTGWTVTDDGGSWTMQEPFGAYTWYAVNDQPSDKAWYDFTLRVPAPFVGVANGELQERTTSGGDTITRWQLDRPASSYLITVAFGDFVMTEDTAESGMPITYWTPRDRPDLLRRVEYTPEALAWVEDRLGPYPFRTLGILVVDSLSGMETQTMITLGDTRYATSPEVLVHEIAHQWYGDQVTPVDWRDVWMNEGMATYVQGVWMAQSQGEPISAVMDSWAGIEARERAAAGPPAAYDPDSFGSSNVYYGPALMWDDLRQRLGDKEFWRLVAAWPEVYADSNADYNKITTWWTEQTGQDLSAFFNAWLLGKTTPQH